MSPSDVHSSPHRRWFDRRFELGLPREAFPDILERVRSTPASVIDHFFFVAEHDDHHLAAIGGLIRAHRSGGVGA